MNYQEKCRWLADFYREAAETGRTIQMQNVKGWMDSPIGPCLSSYTLDWRLKPESAKAWVVWGPGGPSAIIGEDIARQYARECGGTIQEITRPDK